MLLDTELPGLCQGGRGQGKVGESLEFGLQALPRRCREGLRPLQHFGAVLLEYFESEEVKVLATNLGGQSGSLFWASQLPREETVFLC